MAADWLVPAVSGAGGALVTAVFAYVRDVRSDRNAHTKLHDELEDRIIRRIDRMDTALGDQVGTIADTVGFLRERVAGIEGVSGLLVGHMETPVVRAARRRQRKDNEG